MSPRRALRTAAFAIAAFLAAAPARAQEAAAEPDDGRATGERSAAGDELRRLDPATLSGGDYGGADPVPLAGGDYGRTAEPEAAPRRPAIAVDVGDPLSRPLGPAAPPTLRRLRAPEDDAYAPLGVRAGTFLIRPTLESTGGYDDNPDRLPSGGKGSGFLRLRGDVEAQSDWSQHQLTLRANGQIRKYVDKAESGLEPEGGVTLDGRADVSARTQIETQLRASITTSRPGDPETPDDIKGDEIETSYGATLGATHRFNRFSLRLQGLVDRFVTDDAELLGGGTADNSDQIYTAYEVRLRGAYDLSPRLQPFAEVAVDTRDYDERTGDDGRRLGSSGYALRTGARFEATRLITGELAVGYGRQTPKDGGLAPIGGLLLDGSVAWAPTALTTVTFDARSSLQETTLAGSGGILSRNVGVAVEHRLRRNLTVTARANLERSDYDGIGRVDDGLTFELEGEYRLNRTTALTASFAHERLDSSLPGEDYAASIIEFGLRFRL